MKVIVDTSVWSLALRRQKQESSPTVQEFKRMIHRVSSFSRQLDLCTPLPL